MALLFEKPSLRTRVSFEAAMVHLGGSSLFLGQDVGFGSRESIADFGRVLGEYVDVIVVRANRHDGAVDLAEHCNCSVINGLTDFGHPCQAMADLYTIRELVGGRLEGRTLAWIGDANNVARSVALGCGKLGMRLVMAVPDQVSVQRQVAGLDSPASAGPGSRPSPTDPIEAVCDAVAIYTDVWASMGQEAEREIRRADFAPYQVNARLDVPRPEGRVLHALPAGPPRRGSDRRGDRRPAKRRRAAGRQSHARAEGHPGLAAGHARAGEAGGRTRG